MRIIILLLITYIFSFDCVSQVVEAEDACIEKCSHAHLFSRTDQADFYQYPSMEKYDVKYLKLDLAVEAANAFISGTALTVVKAVQPLDSFVTEFKSTMVLDSVFINGVKMSFQRGSDHVYIPLSPVIPVGTTVSALFYYRGTVSSGAIYIGTIASNGLSYTATLSESYQAREWFPVKQILRDKIDSADIWITTSATNKAGSNGLLVAVENLPLSKKLYKWKTRYPMAYYLPSFSVGNYFEYLNYAKPAAMAPDSILIQNYVADNTSYFNSIKANLDKTPAFIEKYSELFGLYPFKNEKYGHAQANIGGGMEHQTMTTLSSFGSTLIAHELGHQWWGDNITCATWNHIWLNEGFASYCEYLGIEKLPALFSPTTAASFMQSVHTTVMSVSNGSVYVPDASLFDESRIFNSRLSYKKGSAIIHNLRFEMQDDTLFFNTLKNFQQQFKDSTATANDFKLVAETTSGKNFTDFFNQWYYGEGFPTFNINYSKQGTDTVILIVNETVSAPTVTPFFKGIFEFKITSSQGDTVVKVNLGSNNQQFKFYYTKTPSGIVIDPNNWVLNANGTIVNSTPGFDFTSPAPASISCGGPTTAVITLGTTSTLGYITPVTLSASGIPPGTNISFSVNPVIPGNSTVVTLSNTHTLSAGTYNITITGVSGTITQTRVISYIIQAGTGPTITTQPLNQSVCAGLNATFNVVVSGIVNSYQWQLSLDGGNNFTNISLATGASYTVSNAIFSQHNNRYRVIVSTQCGSTTSNSVALTVNSIPSIPVITASANPICLGDIINLSAVSESAYSNTWGSGTSTSVGNTTGTTLGPNSLQNYYGGSKQQMLILSSELTGLGMINGSVISSIKLNLTTADATLGLQNLVVKMKNSSATALSSAWETGLTIVRTAAAYNPTSGFNSLVLNTAFIWDGTSNLVIEINYSNANAGTTGSVFNTAKYSATGFVSTRFYRVDNASVATVDSYSGTPTATYSQRNDITIDFKNPAGITWAPVAILYNNAIATIPYIGTSTNNIYAKPLVAGTNNITATATSSFGCTSSAIQPVSVSNCSASITLNMKLILQGYYIGSGMMQPVLSNQAVQNSLITEADTLIVKLHHPTTFALIDTKKAVLLTNGTVSATFAQPAASYYVAIKHRNTLLTWTMAAIACTSSTPVYDFSIAANKAMGNNQVQVEPGVWAFFTGDLNQDDFIDGNDFPAFDTDSFNGVNSVYVATDMNGDGFVDGNDFPVFDVNSFNGVSAVHP